MALILAFFLGGTLLGLALRRAHRQSVISLANRSVMPSVYLLLFWLGLAVSSKKEVVASLGPLGADALILAVGSTLGSLIFAWFIHRKFFEQRFLSELREIQPEGGPATKHTDAPAPLATLAILFAFVLGVVLGVRAQALIPLLAIEAGSTYALYLLLFLVGITVGADTMTWRMLAFLRPHLLLVPCAVFTGSLAGSLAASLFLPHINRFEAMSVGAGVGYYSLSSAIVSQMAGPSLGFITLLANVLREISTILLAPILVRIFGPLAPIAAGGATSMDTTLPSVTLYAGRQYALLAVFNGLVLSFVVPLAIPILLRLRTLG